MKIQSILTLGLFLGLLSCQPKDEVKTTDIKTSADKEMSVAKTDDYPLETCVVSGEKLGSMGDSVVLMHEGTEVRFCCEKCLPKFKADPEKYLAKLNTEKK